MRYCLCLDLVDDPSLIRQYEEWHRKVWPEILQSIKDSGIHAMDIYRAGNRLFMIMETAPNFSFEAKKSIRRLKSKSSGVGTTYVEVSAAAAVCKARRKVDPHG